MRTIALALSVLTVVAMAPTFGEALENQFSARLTSAQETGPGHPTASGRFRLSFSNDFSEARFELRGTTSTG